MPTGYPAAVGHNLGPQTAGMPHEFAVVSSEQVYDGRVIAVRRDQVAMPGDTTSQRDVVLHPGAVGVLALDEQDRVVVVTQYRHPVGRRLDELPAGLLDVAGEDPLAAAKRELAEEAGLAAATWHVLVDVLTSPGMTDEAVRVYLARDLSEADRDVQEHEEVEMTSRRVPLEELVAAALSGELENAMAVTGVLAASVALARGGLRPADAPWPAKAR
jgi:8-oxo-dGDP phosphatase